MNFVRAAFRKVGFPPASPASAPTCSHCKYRKTAATISRSCRRPCFWTCALGRLHVLHLFLCRGTCLLQLRLPLKPMPPYFCKGQHLAHCGRADTLIPLPHAAGSCKVPCFSPPASNRASLGPACHVTKLHSVHQASVLRVTKTHKKSSARIVFVMITLMLCMGLAVHLGSMVWLISWTQAQGNREFGKAQYRASSTLLCRAFCAASFSDRTYSRRTGPCEGTGNAQLMHQEHPNSVRKSSPCGRSNSAVCAVLSC